LETWKHQESAKVNPHDVGPYNCPATTQR